MNYITSGVGARSFAAPRRTAVGTISPPTNRNCGSLSAPCEAGPRRSSRRSGRRRRCSTRAYRAGDYVPGKNSFIFYYEWGESFALLSPVEQAQLLASILEYHRTGKAPVLEGAVKMAFSFIKATLDRDRQKWEHVKEARTQAGRKGGIASGKSRKQNQMLCLLSKRKQMKLLM